MNKILRILIPAAAAAVLSGCAQQVTESTGAQAKEYLDLFMSTEYPTIQPDQWGMYILSDTPGTGADRDKDASFAYLRCTIRSFGGEILSSTEEDIEKQLDQDSYKSYNYYGPRYFNTAEGKGYAGLEYLLEGMKVGGKRTAIMPAWLATTSRFGTMKEYLDACTSSTHLIYEITFEGQCQDISVQEITELREYVTAHYGASQESTTYKTDQAGGTFYFVSDTTSFKEEDKRADDATLDLIYTGRRLDGQAFDTNSQEVALKEGLFVKEKTYEASSVKFSKEYSSISMGGTSSLIEGFKAGLYKMHWAGQKATVLFVSDLGYAATGSGSVIPPYCPLIFELELKEDE